MFKALAKLLESRKIKLGIIGMVASTVTWVGGRVGLDLDPAIVDRIAGSILGLIALIIGAIAHEDAAAKGAGMAPVAAPNNTAAVVPIAPPDTTTNIGEVKGDVAAAPPPAPPADATPPPGA